MESLKLGIVLMFAVCYSDEGKISLQDFHLKQGSYTIGTCCHTNLIRGIR
jgi:hypothetical protein